MRCELCINEAEYRYEEQNMCGDCLFDALVNDGKITSCTETTWYLDGEYIGDTCGGLNMEYEEIADYFSIEEVATNE